MTLIEFDSYLYKFIFNILIKLNLVNSRFSFLSFSHFFYIKLLANAAKAEL